MNNEQPHTIYICDDHTLFAESLQAYFELHDNYKVIGYSSNIHQAYDDILKLHPNIVLIDYQLKSSNGLELLKKLKATKFKVKSFILTMKNDMDLKIQSKELGSSGYLLKEISGEEMIDIFESIMKSEADFIDSSESLKDNFRSTSKLVLTKREFEIANLVCKGLSSNEIAKQLHLSVLTVSTHRKHILKKLNVKNPLELLHKLQG
jgi:DNA-binding NarL/FixJ family response regulator